MSFARAEETVMPKADKQQEVVIDHVSPFLARLGYSLGVLLSLGLLLLAGDFWGDFQMGDRGGFVIVGVVVALFSVLGLYSLTGNRPFIETSDDGLMVGGIVRFYCPWSNVRDIRVAKVPRTLAKILVSGDNAMFEKVEQVVVDINSAGDILYDNRIHSILSFLVVNKASIRLELRCKTTKPTVEVCGRLRERWKQATDEEWESRA
ncbi:MAG: hypothetical protein AB7D39_02410 [Pseudodesulfovibrio sp.]|uniref:hypothetical protein n=1 Tax=Pseudodesulfovibrio sp. TaxID=2035812 RepID=UPI003D12FA71